MNAKCPRCGSDASISLSFPNLFECPSCRCSFGPGDNGLAADSRIVRSVAISVEPIFSDAWSFSIRETEDGAAFDCRTGLMGWSRKGRGEIDKEEWQAFIASVVLEPAVTDISADPGALTAEPYVSCGINIDPDESVCHR